MHTPGLKRWSLQILLTCVGMLALASLEACLFLRVSVARDEQGVPLLQGSNRLDLAYATGFIHAQDRFFQMDLLRRVGVGAGAGAGELAELFGARAEWMPAAMPAGVTPTAMPICLT